jgi:iron complex outermembrane receptor protein
MKVFSLTILMFLAGYLNLYASGTNGNSDVPSSGAPHFFTDNNRPPVPILGKVTNADGEPLAGATVSEKGVGNTVITQDDGSFSINVRDVTSVLVVSFVGFETREIVVGTQVMLTIALQDAGTMSDVVVIGYGTSRKRDLTGAISSLSEKDLNPGAITNPLQQIAGRAPGVSVRQVGNEPGSNPNVRIRGITSNWW